MKLVRFGAPGAEKPGLVDAQGAIRDLSAARQGHHRRHARRRPASTSCARSTPSRCRWRRKGVRLGPPVGGVRNFIAVGLNYVDHAKETGAPIPAEPILFNKLPNCIVGPNDDVMIPKGSIKLDYEVEIAFVIGTRARYVDEKDALSHIAGYCICNDVSERALPGRARRPVDEGQVRRDVRAAGPVARRRATRSRTCRTCPCRSTSTASAARPATPRP